MEEWLLKSDVCPCCRNNYLGLKGDDDEQELRRREWRQALQAMGLALAPSSPPQPPPPQPSLLSSSSSSSFFSRRRSTPTTTTVVNRTSSSEGHTTTDLSSSSSSSLNPGGYADSLLMNTNPHANYHHRRQNGGSSDSRGDVVVGSDGTPQSEENRDTSDFLPGMHLFYLLSRRHRLAEPQADNNPNTSTTSTTSTTMHLDGLEMTNRRPSFSVNASSVTAAAATSPVSFATRRNQSSTLAPSTASVSVVAPTTTLIPWSSSSSWGDHNITTDDEDDEDGDGDLELQQASASPGNRVGRVGFRGGDVAIPSAVTGPVTDDHDDDGIREDNYEVPDLRHGRPSEASDGLENDEA
jgi:hypothetical protein